MPKETVDDTPKRAKSDNDNMYSVLKKRKKYVRRKTTGATPPKQAKRNQQAKKDQPAKKLPVKDTKYSVGRKRRKYVRRKPSGFSLPVFRSLPADSESSSFSSSSDEEFEPKPSTSSTPDPDPIEYRSFVTPENLKRYKAQGKDPEACAMYRYKRSKTGRWKFHPKLIKSVMNAYKDSPDYKDLKAKRFNTSFLHETRRGPRDIEIFTPEELAKMDEELNEFFPKPEENPAEPGETYKNVFMDWVGLPSVLDDPILLRHNRRVERRKRRAKREGRRSTYGRRQTRVKQRVGPLTDEQMAYPWDKYGPEFFLTSEESEDSEEEIMKNRAKLIKKKKSNNSLLEDSEDDYVPSASRKKSLESNEVKVREKRKSARIVKYTEIDCDENEASEGEQTSCTLKTIDASEISRHDSLKLSEHKAMIAEKEQKEKEEPSENTKEDDIYDEPLLDYLFRRDSESDKSVSPGFVKVKKQGISQKKPENQKKRGRPSKASKPFLDSLLPEHSASINILNSDKSVSRSFVKVKEQGISQKKPDNQKKRGRPSKASKQFLDNLLPEHSVSINILNSDMSTSQDALKSKTPEKQKHKRSVKSKNGYSSLFDSILNDDSSIIKVLAQNVSKESNEEKVAASMQKYGERMLKKLIRISPSSSLPSTSFSDQNTVIEKEKSSSPKSETFIPREEQPTSVPIKMAGLDSNIGKPGNDSVDVEKDENAGNSINCSILLNLLNSPNGKKVDSTAMDKPENESSSFASAQLSISPRVVIKKLSEEEIAKKSKDVTALKKVSGKGKAKLLPFEKPIKNRVLRVYLKR